MATPFQHAEQFFHGADAPRLAALVAATADLALIIDADDVVRDLAVKVEDAGGLGVQQWRGQPLAQLVDDGCRPSLAGLLARARNGEHGVELELRHATTAVAGFPVRYTAFKLGEPHPLLLIGRDRRALVELATQLLAGRRMPSYDAATTPSRSPRGSDSVATLARLHGTRPLKDVVRDATTEIERTCIEAALRMTGDNRSAAARVLGLSRQSLYVKLRRFGLAGDGELTLNGR